MSVGLSDQSRASEQANFALEKATYHTLYQRILYLIHLDFAKPLNLQ